MPGSRRAARRRREATNRERLQARRRTAHGVREFVKTETDKYGKIIKTIGLKRTEQKTSSVECRWMPNRKLTLIAGADAAGMTAALVVRVLPWSCKYAKSDRGQGRPLCASAAGLFERHRSSCFECSTT